MSDTSSEERRTRACTKALELVVEAMDLIDAHKGPPEAAVNLELSRQHLHRYVLKARR
jgi:hypothetical protein